MRTRRLAAPVLASLVGALVLGLPALAWFTSRGVATGSASSAAGLATFTTSAAVPQGALLYPGGPAAPLTLNVNNSANSYALLVTGIALDTSRPVSVDAAHAAGCPTPALSVSTPSGWSGLAVAARSSSGAVTVSSAVSMGTTASSGCQGATFTVPVTLSGRNT